VRALHVSKSSEGAFWAVRQVRELVKLGVEAHVVLPNSFGTALPEWRETGAELHFLDCSLPVRLHKAWKAASDVRRLVSRVNPDIIHSHHVTTTTMLRLALGKNHRVPRIFQVPGPLHLEHWHTCRFELFLAGEKDFWIGASRFINHLYRQAGVSNEKVFMSYHSTDASEFSARRIGFLRKRLDIPEDAFVVGNINLIYSPKRYLGQTVGLKCHEDVIEAIHLVQQERNDVWGVLIGGSFGSAGKYEASLRKLAEEKGKGRILMPGKFNSKEVAESWPDFDCAVHVPISENCGGVVEPLLCEIPTIAGEVGGLPEVVLEGRTGKLVAARRPESLAEGILEVMQEYERYKRMAQLGRKLVSVMFDPQRCAAEIHSIYQHVLFGHKPPAEFDAQQFLNESRMAEDSKSLAPCLA
jgi:glycosyltransferase involved in cell wall biosynthesis